MIESGFAKVQHLMLLFCVGATLQPPYTVGSVFSDGGKVQSLKPHQLQKPLQSQQSQQSQQPHQPQQRFRVRPANLSVVEGETAVLRCQVEHQTGALQWTKQGFALGYLHHLPGYPRYRMVGDLAAGEHNLEIRNVSLSDDGSFQCQVLPKRGQRAIKAAAFLTVLVKPESVTITSPSRELPDRRYEMMVNRKLILECNVTDARPAAVIVWQKNGQNITQQGKLPADYSEKITVLPSTNKQQQKQLPDSSVLYTTVSRLAVPLTVEDNNARFTCSLQHPAVGHSQQKHFEDSVHVSVLYPPGAPKITGADQHTGLIAGDSVNLTCHSRDGNPPADIVWFEDQQTLPRHYRLTDRGAEARVLVTTSVKTGRSLFRCQVSSAVRPKPQEATVRLQVYYGPLKVSVRGSREARSGDQVPLQCLAGSSQPAANITWTVDDRTVKTQQQLIGDELNGFTTSSNISVHVPEGIDRDIKVTCNAANVNVGVTRRSSVIITVLRPPKQPYITGLTEDHWLADGDIVSLACTAKGGHPLANLTWWTDSSYITAGAQRRHLDGVSRQLTLTVNSEDNGRKITCSSDSPAMSRPQSVSVTLRVTFLPKSLHTETLPANRPLTAASSEAQLVCQSAAANPPVTLSWVDENDRVIKGHEKVTHIKSGHHGGLSTRLALSTNFTWRDNGRTVLCVANVADRPVLTSPPIKLNVAHAPVFEQTEYRLDVPAGGTNQTLLTIHANPSNGTRLAVTRPAAKHGTNRLEVIRNRMVLVENASRQDMGWYQIEASNRMGVAAANLYVNVLYPPAIVEVSKSIMVRAGEAIRILCRIDANPISSDSVFWLRNGHRLSNTKVQEEFVNGTAFLVLPDANSTGTGYYSCVANNSIGRSSAEISVIVEDKARICSDQSTQQFISIDFPSSAEITCYACGSSNITFRWLRHNAELPVQTKNSSDAKYIITKSRFGLTKWKSTLLINRVDRSDVGAHKCLALNRYGSDQIEIALRNSTRPQVPTLLRADKASHNTVTLTWRSGFDGGSPQRFILRYKFGDSPYQYVDNISDNNSTYEINNLRQDSKYHFWISAYNRLGQSEYTQLPVTVHTAGAPPVGFITDRDDEGPAEEPSAAAGGAGAGSSGSLTGSLTLSQLLVIGSMGAGSILLIVNTSIALCYLRRRRSMRSAAGSVLVKPGSKPHRDDCSNRTVELRHDADCGGYSAQSRFDRGVSTVSITTSDTFLRDDSTEFFQGSETLENSSLAHTDTFLQSAHLHDKQQTHNSSVMEVSIEDATCTSLDHQTHFQQLEPPRLPQFLQRRTLHSKAPDLIENGVGTISRLPSRNSCHFRLPLSSADPSTLPELSAPPLVRPESSTLGLPSSTAHQKFASLPRAPGSGLVTFSHVTTPPLCIELEPINHHV